MNNYYTIKCILKRRCLNVAQKKVPSFDSKSCGGVVTVSTASSLKFLYCWLEFVAESLKIEYNRKKKRF